MGRQLVERSCEPQHHNPGPPLAQFPLDAPPPSIRLPLRHRRPDADRAQIQRVLAGPGVLARPEKVLVTVRGRQALHIAIRLLPAQGETIGVEDAGYPVVVNMARIEGINVERPPVDEEGSTLWT